MFELFGHDLGVVLRELRSGAYHATVERETRLELLRSRAEGLSEVLFDECRPGYFGPH